MLSECLLVSQEGLYRMDLISSFVQALFKFNEC